MDYSKFQILVDVPAQEPKLGFPETARGLASLIRESEPRFAIAIYGPWGSGKTTLMNAIREEVRDVAVIVEFSAWRYEREEHLIVPLLDSLRDALIQWQNAKRSEENEKTDKKGAAILEKAAQAAGKTAQTVGRVIASLLAGMSFKLGIPGALDLSFDANKALSASRAGAAADAAAMAAPPPTPGGDRFSERLAAAPDLPQSFYHACFVALKEAFETFYADTGHTRLVVFVDDLDRCLPAGTLEVLESMKLFFDLPGFVFVVGLDREVVERCIDSRYRIANTGSPVGGEGEGREEATGMRLIRGADYLKKIFQVPFSLAPVPVSQIKDLVISLTGDDGAGNFHGPLPIDQAQDLRDKVSEHLRFLFGGSRLNPREVKRYINAYTIQMKVKPGLNADVVLALNTLALRDDCASLYRALVTYREEVILALQGFQEDMDALEAVELSAGDLPLDIRTYLAPGGPGHELLNHADQLDVYLEAGEATRSSSGGYFLEVMRRYQELRTRVMRAMRAANLAEFDSDWPSATGLLKQIQSDVSSLSPSDAEHPGAIWQSLSQWLESMPPEPAWMRFQAQLGTPTSPEELSETRVSAKKEAETHLRALRDELTRLRRRASFSS